MKLSWQCENFYILVWLTISPDCKAVLNVSPSPNTLDTNFHIWLGYLRRIRLTVRLWPFKGIPNLYLKINCGLRFDICPFTCLWAQAENDDQVLRRICQNLLTLSLTDARQLQQSSPHFHQTTLDYVLIQRPVVENHRDQQPSLQTAPSWSDIWVPSSSKE